MCSLAIILNHILDDKPNHHADDCGASQCNRADLDRRLWIFAHYPARPAVDNAIIGLFGILIREYPYRSQDIFIRLVVKTAIHIDVIYNVGIISGHY